MEKKLEEVSAKVAEGSMSGKVLEHEVKIIYDFTLKILQEFKGLIKAVVMYGSLVRHQLEKTSDLDVLILIDDASVNLTPTLMDYYEHELVRILRQEGSQLKIHANTLTLSQFWDGVRIGDPIIINILRDGAPIADAGFFEPLKLLLLKGKIRPTPEAVDFSMSRSYLHVSQYLRLLLEAAGELYWAAIDSAHAALMKEGHVPPTPKQVALMMQKELKTKNKSVKDKHIKLMERLYKTMKEVTHGRKDRISGKELDELFKETQEFIKVMKDIAI